MTTEESENKLKITKNTCIHCSTLELAKQVLNIFHQLGLKWSDGNHYITYTHWDRYRKNTIYYPFEGEFSSLNYARLIDYKIISAEEFIALHTEGEKFDLENYIPKGGLEGFPKEIIARMLEIQEEQGNPRNVTVFEEKISAIMEGFTWGKTKEGWYFWGDVINNKNFNHFFEKYPKQDNQNNSQEFRVDDLENYMPKGELEGFPKEIITRMLNYQEEQGNPRDISVFEKRVVARYPDKGFEWDYTQEGWDFWHKVINNKNFNFFFEKYPKKDYLENYIPKGELKGFPKEIIARMLECQEEQCNPRDISVFERNKTAGEPTKGFVWGETKEGYDFWNTVIRYKNFAHFFEWYPKQNNQDNSQDFKVGDKVIDIITRQIGFVKNINLKEVTIWQLAVVFEDCTTKFYSLEGKYYNDSKIPILLHYQDDYDYDVIDFNNLPKRQGAKRWRAIKGGVYYSFTSNFGVEESTEDNDYLDNEAYDSGNYFQTKEEAQEVADKLNKYFQELINPNKPAVINLINIINKHGKELII